MLDSQRDKDTELTVASSRLPRTARFTVRSLAAVLMIAASVSAGCAERPFIWVASLPTTTETQTMIGPRDTILVLVRNQPALSGEFVVRDDGGYLQPTLGNVEAAGKEVGALAAELKTKLQHMVVEPDISVAVLKAAPARVSVVGEVKTPGSYELTRDRGVINALAAAGWLTDFARRDRVFVVRRAAAGAVETPRRIRFRAEDLTSPESNAARFRLRDGDVVVAE
jgi:polysaccharide biosynthesis/export protein